MPSRRLSDPWAEAVRQFTASIRMPQSDVGLYEWLETAESFHPHWGQRKVVDAVLEGYREIGVVAPPRCGKCLPRGTRVLLANGALLPIEDIPVGAQILSLGDDLRLVPAPVTATQHTGPKRCLSFVMADGRSITLSTTHPLLTDGGWRESQFLHVGDWVALPRAYPEMAQNHYPTAEMAILGYLLGDGSCVNGSARFTNVDTLLIEHLRSCLPPGITLRYDGRYTYTLSGGRRGGVSTPITRLMRRYHLMGVKSKHKRIPAELFTASNDSLAPLLSALFDCDATVDRVRIEICLASSGLIDDIQHLLLRFGIRGRKYYKQSTCNGQRFDAWRLSISDGESVLAYATKIGFNGSKAGELDALQRTKLASHPTRNDTIPHFPKDQCRESCGPMGRWHNAMDREGYDLLQRTQREHTSRANAQLLADHFHLGEELAYSDLVWERVKSITDAGVLDTFDLEVGSTNVFIANDVIVHNSAIAREIAKYMVLNRSARCWILGPTWDDVDRTLLPLWDEFEKEAAKAGTVITKRNRESRKIDTAGGGFLEGVSWAVLSQIEAQGIDMAVTDESQYLTEPVVNKIRDRLEGDYLWLMVGRPEATGGSYFEELMLHMAQDKTPGFFGPVTWPRWANPDPKIRRSVWIELEILKHYKETKGKGSPEYLQRYKNFLVSFAGKSLPPPDRAISTFEPELHVQNCAYDPDLPVYLAIDPGFYPSYYAVCAFQPHPLGTMLKKEEDKDKKDSEKGKRQEELWQIDEIYVQQTITDDVISMCQAREWWKGVKEAVIDVAARQSNRQTGLADIAIWQKRSHFPVLAESVTIDEGLATHRRWCQQNRLFHDPEKCPNTIREYSLYKMKARKIGDAKDIPIDAWNHAMKCVCYFLVTHYGVTDTIPETVKWVRQIGTPRRRRR